MTLDIGMTLVWDDISPGSSGRYPGEPIPVRAGSVPKAHGLVRTTPASSGHPDSGGRHKVRQLPGGRRKPGLDYITWGIGVGDGVWRGQKDGSVVISRIHTQTLDLHSLIQLMNFLQGFCLCEPGVVKCLSRRRGASGCRPVLHKAGRREKWRRSRTNSHRRRGGVQGGD